MAKQARRIARRRRTGQGELYERTWGGARRGAGRKRVAPRPLVAHRSRESFRGCCPVHVTLRLVEGLPSLRTSATYRVVLEALGAGSQRFGLRLVHWSVLGNHVHLMVEARDRRALSRGMQGLGVRLARALNRWWGRRGKVLADRFHARVLRSPREVRAALQYVLLNARKHGVRVRDVDPCSSGRWFDGWRAGVRRACAESERPAWLGEAATWLLSRGWRRLGLLEVSGRPSGP